MKRTLLLGLCLMSALGILLFVSACGGGAPATKEPIKVGFLTSYTGAFADYGPLQEEGVKMRLEEVNYQFAGRPIKLFINDDASDAGVALDKVKKMITMDKIDVLIGPLLSPCAAAVAPYLGENKVPGIGLMTKPYATSKSGAYLLPYGSLYQEGMVLGWYAWDFLKYKSVTTIGADMVNGREFITGAVDMFKQKGGTVVQQQWPKPTEIDFGPYLTAMQKADASMSWLGTAQEMQFMKQYKEFGIKTPPLLVSADQLRTHQLKALGDSIVGVKGSIQYSSLLDNAANKKFVAAFRAKFNKPPERDQHSSYVAASIMLLGLEATKGDTAYDKLYPAMLKLKIDDPQGPIVFESNGNGVVSKYIAEAKVVNGEYVWSPIYEYKEVKYQGP